MKQKKCKYCQQYDDIENLTAYQQVDMKHKLKFDIKGQPVFFYAHAKCKEKVELEKQEKNELYDYVLAKYFNRIVPPLFLKGIQELRKSYTFKLQKECLEYCENDISQCKVFDNTHLCRLLIYFIKQYIEDYLIVKANLEKVQQDIKDKQIVTVKRAKEIQTIQQNYDGIL